MGWFGLGFGKKNISAQTNFKPNQTAVDWVVASWPFLICKKKLKKNIFHSTIFLSFNTFILNFDKKKVFYYYDPWINNKIESRIYSSKEVEIGVCKQNLINWR